MFLLIGYLFLALVVSFMCSILEAVLLSTPLSFPEIIKQETRVEALAKSYTPQLRRRLKSALLFIKMKKNIDRPLSAILSLNTVAHTVGAAGVGAQSAVVFGDVYLGLTSACLTFIILVFSEILPKSIGARYWRNLALTSCRVIRVLVIICYPLVIFSEIIGKLVTRGKAEQIVSREEVSAMVNMGSKEGIFIDGENKSLQSLLSLPDLKARDIMTPRIVACIASEEMTLGDFYKKKEFFRYSRIPIHEEGNQENIVGFVLLKNIFEQLADDKFNLNLKDFRRDILHVPDTQSVISIWKLMQDRRMYMAIIVDEYGSFEGLVTMEDVVESMLGQEIVDEKDTIADLQAYAKAKWQARQIEKKID